MKGNALMIAVIMIGIMVALFIGYGLSFNLFDGEGSLQKTRLQYSIYTIEHSFDAAKLYVDTSLNYAVYQACYDNLKRAGLSEITPETGESGLAYLPSLTSEEFYSNLKSTTETYFGRYISNNYIFLSEHGVSLPGSVITVTPQTDSRFTVNAIPSGMMTTSSLTKTGEYITLRSSADISENYDMPCYPIYKKAAEINDDIIQSLQVIMDSAKQSIEEKISNSETACASLGRCSDLTDALGEMISDPANSAPQDDEYLTETDMKDFYVNIDLVDSGKIRQYSVSMTQTIKIQEKEPSYYPVWNGTDISFENMELIYLTGLTGTSLIKDST
jgi:hypothetical protein